MFTCSQILKKRTERGNVTIPRINTLFTLSEILKEGASNDDPLRHLKHFLCQDDAEILDLGSDFTTK